MQSIATSGFLDLETFMNLVILKSKLSYLIMGGLIAVSIFVLLEQFPIFFSYLHYLRIPLLAGLILFALPIIAGYNLPNRHCNWLVVSSPCQLAFIVVTVIGVGLGIGITAQVLLSNIPCRYFNDCALVDVMGESFWPYALGIVLGIPTIYFAYQAAGSESLLMTETQRQCGTSCGISCAVVLLWVAFYFNTHPAIFDIQQNLYAAFSYLPGSNKGYIVNDEVTFGHTKTFWIVALAAVVYLGYGQIFRPILAKHQPPALFYVAVSILIFTLLFSFLTFWLDYYDIPVLLLTVAWIMTVYCFWGAEHHYDLNLVSDNFVNKPNGKFTHSN